MGLFDFLKKKPEPEPEKPLTDVELTRAICEEIWAETARPVLRYTLEPGEPDILDSKIGGTPYLPRGEAWPLDGKGNPMDLLAQINCVQLVGLPNFPHTGLLQFFIAREDVYGMDFDDGIAQTGFRVIYREVLDLSVTAEEVQAKRPPAPEGEEDWYSPIGQFCRIVFGKAEEQGLTDGDYRWNDLFVKKWNQRRPEAPIKHPWDCGEEDYEKLIHPEESDGPHHQMGGYPFFTQSDPREYQENYQDLDILLFQLDSEMRDRKDLVLWGDCGVGGFFISPEALKARDFSRVLYNWDCC